MEDKRPFFSVIVPAFNSSGYIRKLLDSIKAQTCTDYELIIVCDKCVDNTAEIAREYTDKVFEIDHDIDGPGRNKGLDEARGEWVLFADDDDWYLHEFVFQMLKDVLGPDNTEIDVLCFSFIWRGRGYTFNSPWKIWPAIWNKCWRREFIGDHRFPVMIQCEDLGFAQEMHPLARYGFFDTPFYYYNFLRPGSMSEKIRNGEYDNSNLPEHIRKAADGYEQTLLKNTKI